MNYIRRTVFNRWKVITASHHLLLYLLWFSTQGFPLPCCAAINIQHGIATPCVTPLGLFSLPAHDLMPLYSLLLFFRYLKETVKGDAVMSSLWSKF